MNTKLQKTTIPAIACSLEGGYLIEASAGTGKTWTLTGILLRLLIEKKYPPERIIATTFTRNSAKEMQERLQSRLNEFYHYIHWLQSQKQHFAHWFIKSDNQDIEEILNQIKTQACDFGIVSFDDAINLYLIAHLLQDDNPKALDFALLRTSLLLATLDKLFIGTLDSLAQKWLKEFSSEMSQQADATITMNGEDIIHSLVHDELRREHSFMSVNSPRLYRMIDTSIFNQIKPACDVVAVALNFHNAPIDGVPIMNDDTIDALDASLDEIMRTDFSVFEPFYDIEYAKSFGFHGSSVITKGFGHMANIIRLIQSHQSGFVHHLNAGEKKLLSDLAGIYDDTKLFRKNQEENKAKFYALPVHELMKIREIYQKILSLKDDYQVYFYQKIAITIKQKLKTTLEHKKQSTFTHQMVMLNEALANNPSLARHIRYLYPVALIDESQDINGLQAEMIQHIYLNPLKKEIQKDKKTRGFLLLVGDPKQAIYLFRGGDVANYNMIKYTKTTKDNQSLMVLNHELMLNENRRSHEGLIGALNEWFCWVDDGAHNHANLGENIYYQKISTQNHQTKLSWQNNHQHIPDYLSHHAVSVLYFSHDESQDEYQSVAHHINSLLQEGHTITQDGMTRQILPTDIAVLARNYDDLNLMKQHLNQLNIRAISPKEIHVFTTQSAKDLYYLLSLITDGMNHQKLGTLLTSAFFGLSLEEVMNLLTHEANVYHELIAYFNQARTLFHQKGVIASINYCLGKNPLKKFYPNTQKNTLWEQIATQKERYMADLSQVIELIGIRQHGTNHRDGQFMSWFLSMTQGVDKSDIYNQLPLPSETGVTLMTIHKSKGLEFPIVYVFGLDKKPIDKKINFYPYSDENFLRRISPTPNKTNDDDFFEHQFKTEQTQELKRLGYVALTRASEQVFVIARVLKNPEKNIAQPLFLWFDSDGANLSLPKRLSDKVGWIDMNQSGQLNQKSYQPKHHDFNHVMYEDWYQAFDKRRFYAEISTSATDMMKKLEAHHALNREQIDEDDIEIQHDISHDDEIYYPADDIRLTFPKGKEAGTFLHQLLKHTQAEYISEVINKTAKSLGFYHYTNQENTDEEINQIHQTNHEALACWIDDIISVPMLSSGVCLKQLPTTNYAKEMSFSLGISPSFNPTNLNALFEKYTDKKINLLDDDMMGYYKYLNGEMDLVYEYQNKFYVVDYKSNFVGNKLSDYHFGVLNEVMNEAGYWLQACIYQVALHRLLSIRIDDYKGNENNYLGEVEFIFLRGLDKHQSMLGHINWSVPIPMILALDEMLGHYEKRVIS